jgi:hypothetical protein
VSGRRRYRPRVGHFLALPVMATAGWGAELWHLAGFLLLGLAGLAFWPLALLVLLAGPHMALYAAVPARWRVRYRKRHGRAGAASSYIPRWLRLAVYRADRWRCVHCQSVAGLQWDHVVPWACGGATALWNGCTLCSACNRLKSCYYPKWDGWVSYGPGAILRSELRARRNPLRWLRLAWAL